MSFLVFDNLLEKTISVNFKTEYRSTKGDQITADQRLKACGFLVELSVNSIYF